MEKVAYDVHAELDDKDIEDDKDGEDTVKYDKSGGHYDIDDDKDLK